MTLTIIITRIIQQPLLLLLLIMILIIVFRFYYNPDDSYCKMVAGPPKLSSPWRLMVLITQL